MENQKTLNVTRIVPNEDGELLRTSKDDREYMQLEFIKPSKGNVISTAKPRYENVWGAGGTVNAKADRLFTEIKKRMNLVDEEGFFKQPLQVVASIETVKIKPHFIPSEYGKFEHPQTQEKANKIHEYTSVVLEDQNIESIARNNGMVPLTDQEAQERSAEETTAEPVLAEQEEEAPSIT